MIRLRTYQPRKAPPVQDFKSLPQTIVTVAIKKQTNRQKLQICFNRALSTITLEMSYGLVRPWISKNSPDI